MGVDNDSLFFKCTKWIYNVCAWPFQHTCLEDSECCPHQWTVNFINRFNYREMNWNHERSKCINIPVAYSKNLPQRNHRLQVCYSVQCQNSIFSGTWASVYTPERPGVHSQPGSRSETHSLGQISEIQKNVVWLPHSKLKHCLYTYAAKKFSRTVL